MNILVRNLSRGVNEQELLQLFQPFGKIKALNIVLDASTGKSKGFGFVDMPEDFEAVAAIKALDGKLVMDSRLRVKKAVKQSYRPQRDNPNKTHTEHFEAGKVNSAVKVKSGSRHNTGHKKTTRKGRP